MVGFVIRDDVCHEWTVFNVLVITHDVDGVLSRLRWPILDVTRAIILVLTLDLRLGRALNGKPYNRQTHSGSLASETVISSILKTGEKGLGIPECSHHVVGDCDRFPVSHNLPGICSKYLVVSLVWVSLSFAISLRSVAHMGASLMSYKWH